jgi:hypothetical protein
LLLLGEPVGIRTRDLLIKSQLLYRLSYGLFCDFRTKAVALVSEFVLFAKWSIAAISASLFKRAYLLVIEAVRWPSSVWVVIGSIPFCSDQLANYDAYHEFGFLQGLLFG